jgi:hypothetical protein
MPDDEYPALRARLKPGTQRVHPDGERIAGLHGTRRVIVGGRAPPMRAEGCEVERRELSLEMHGSSSVVAAVARESVSGQWLHDDGRRRQLGEYPKCGLESASSRRSHHQLESEIPHAFTGVTNLLMAMHRERGINLVRIATTRTPVCIECRLTVT